MSVFNRPMFRIPGMGNNQPSGIMSSGPNIMRASLISGANANPVMTGANQPSVIQDMPIFTNTIPTSRQSQIGNIFGKGEQFEATTKSGIEGEVDPESNLAKLRKAALKTKKVEEGSKVVDDLSPGTGKISQKTTTETVDDGETIDDDMVTPDFGQPVKQAGTEDNTLESNVNILSGFQSNQKQLSDKTAAALASVSSGLASADDIRVGGKTLNENVDALVARMNQEGKEPTLADVQDDAIKLLGFDPKELEGEFEEDRKASIFLNMMKAGLAIAAGESPNAISNIAKGFAVGLQGYGQDVNRLSKQLREDRKEARSTMYNLLKDAKSEALAKRTLELQKMEGIVNINRTLVGDAKKRALDKFNTTMTALKWNQNVLSAAAELEFKEKQLAVTKDNVEKTYRLGLAKAEPEVIQLLKFNGEIKLKDPSKPEIPFGEPGYIKQYDLTDKARNHITAYMDDLVAGKTKGLQAGSEFNQTRENFATTGTVGSVLKPTGYDQLDPSIKKQFGIEAYALQELLKKNANDPYQQFQDTIAFVRRLKDRIPGIAIKYEAIPKDVLPTLERKDKQGVSLLEKYNLENLIG